MSGEGLRPGGRLSEEQLFHWLRLIRSENVGPRTFRQLVNRFGGAEAALEALPGLVARSAPGRVIRLAGADEIRLEMERARTMGVRFLVSTDPDYPPLLREIDAAPPVLALRGEARTFARPCVAIVGSRNASAAGLVFAERLARDLGREDYAICSGLARGVDFAAHRASVQSGTIAVLAGGHARPYPSEHAPLLEKIIERGGAAVSEAPLEWEPRGRDFPRRNRIVSGICAGVVVVEAARRSGSLITARFAAEQGREVFAVPGSPLDPRAEGTNDLLRQGATICTGADDVTQALAARAPGSGQGDLFSEGEYMEQEEPLWDELDFCLQESGPPSVPAQPPRREAGAPAPERRASPETPSVADVRGLVLSLLGPAPISVDELIRASGIPAREVHGVLLELDLAGRLSRHGANLVSLACV